MVHCLAVLTAVTSTSSGTFRAPYIALKLHEPFRPYLQTFFLGNSYRFYAPNPGPNSTCWFRIRFRDGTTRWRELPRHKDFSTSMAFKRAYSLPTLGIELAPDPESPIAQRLSRQSKLCVSSFVRHVVSGLQQGDRSQRAPVESINVYLVRKLFLSPEQVRQGRKADDLRLHRITDLGRYRPDGRRIGGRRTVLSLDIPQFIADVIRRDLASLRRGDIESKPRRTLMTRIRLPKPLRRFLLRHPDLVESPATALRERVQRAIDSGLRPQNTAQHSPRRGEREIAE